MAIEEYPTVLPLGQRNGRSYKTVETVKRSTMVSGRARQRKRYPKVPTMTSLTFLFNDIECSIFTAWFRDALNDGVSWFNMPLRTPLGLGKHYSRFMGMYDGPTHVGPNLWQVTASLEMQDQPLLPAGEGLFPDEIFYTKIFDITMNVEWSK